MAQFMVVLDTTVVNIALPSVQRGLHFSPANLQWVVNGYTLFFGGFLLLGGRAADLLGRKRLFVAGVLLFSIASLLNGFAQSSGMLIVGRGLQGLGGALVSPAALSIITTTFTDASERTRALGVWSAIAAGGAAVGLLLGGVLTDLASWRWVFFVNVPVGIITIALAWRYVAESRTRSSIARSISPARSPSPLVWSSSSTPSSRRSPSDGARASTLGLLAAALALLAAFLVIESRSQAPLMRLEHLPRPRACRGRHGAAVGRVGHVRHVLLRLPVRPGDPRLQPAACGPGLPAGDRRIMIGAGVAQPLIKRVACATSRSAGSRWPPPGCWC